MDSDFDGRWSPDGTHILVSRSGGSLWILDADGSNGRQLISEPSTQDAIVFLSYARWSPDGNRVAYSKITQGADAQLMSISSGATGSPVNVIPGQEGVGPLDWSPDGTQILFTSTRTGNADVFVTLPGGGGSINLTNRTGTDDSPRWSPDGQRIVFVGIFKIWAMDKNGANLINLTGNTGSFGQPIWSPDGDRVFFVSDPGGAGKLMVMNKNGTNAQPIETDPSIDLDPSPSPDGTKMAWSSNRSGQFEIWVSNIDGSQPVRATTGGGRSPRWRPCP